MIADPGRGRGVVDHLANPQVDLAGQAQLLDLGPQLGRKPFAKRFREREALQVARQGDATGPQVDRPLHVQAVEGVAPRVPSN